MTDPLDLLKRRKPRVRRLAVLTDDDLADELDVAQEALVAAEGRAQGHEGDEAAQDAYRAAQAEVERLEAAVDAATVVFRFTGLPRNDWEELMEAHPATPAQVEQATKAGMFFGLDFNPDTFQPAAVAACAVIEVDGGSSVEGGHDIELDEKTVAEWWADPGWNSGDTDQLFNAAQHVNRRSQVVDWGKGSGSTRN